MTSMPLVRPEASADVPAQAVASPAEARLFGVPLHPLTMDQTLDRVEELVKGGGAHQHVVLNAAKLVQVQDDAELREIIGSCSLINADGQSVVWAGRLLGIVVPERVDGIDQMDRLLAGAGDRGCSVYFLGAREDVVRRVAELEQSRHRGLRVAGLRNGFWSPDEETEVVADIAAANADLLFVAMPTPAKERFLARHLDRLG